MMYTYNVHINAIIYFMILSISYRPSLENGSGQLIVTLYTICIYHSVHNQLIRILFEAHIEVERFLIIVNIIYIVLYNNLGDLRFLEEEETAEKTSFIFIN